ncbi:MAG: NAD-dependent epimerase/dehydratase family protein [Microthrixaceae bacterium]
MEQALEWYHRIHGLRVAILRYFNAAGATGPRGEAHQPETHLIPLVLQVALGQRASIAVFGDDYPTPDGSCVRDYIHIEDLASAHVLALHGLDERPFMRYNLGNGAGYSVLEVIETARRVTGHPIPALMQPRRPGDPAILIAGSGQIQAELGWQPQHPDLAEIIGQRLEQWHLWTTPGTRYGGGRELEELGGAQRNSRSSEGWRIRDRELPDSPVPAPFPTPYSSTPYSPLPRRTMSLYSHVAHAFRAATGSRRPSLCVRRAAST